jgi:GNAT superfamily N-acetyltransferase
MMFNRVAYSNLNSRQKENYNFQKVAARLADYGFNSIRLTDDWQGADFIAVHIDDETFLKVQLKGRLVIDRKYQGKGIHVAFLHGDDLYLYDHDALVVFMEATDKIGADSVTWHQKGFRSWPSPPVWAITYLNEFRISQ